MADPATIMMATQALQQQQQQQPQGQGQQPGQQPQGQGFNPAMLSPIIGGALGWLSNRSAQRAQQQANQQALDYQMGQDKRRYATSQQEQQMWLQQMNAWNATRNALLQHYGIDIAPAMQQQISLPQEQEEGKYGPVPGSGVQPGPTGQGLTLRDMIGKKG